MIDVSNLFMGVEAIIIATLPLNNNILNPSE
jgi:hypothetical protein